MEPDFLAVWFLFLNLGVLKLIVNFAHSVDWSRN